MSENKNTALKENEIPQQSFNSESLNAPAYMNRMFCSTKERIAYVLKCTLGSVGLGKYDIGSDLYMYTIYGVEPTALAKAQSLLVVYDVINDPLSATIIDRMRSRWGKFKPFQYLALIPNLLLGFFNIILPFIADANGSDAAERLWMFMAISFMSETVGAFVGGGGYIDKVFTPNPNERTSLIVAANFVSEFIARLPEQIVGILYDLVANGVIKMSIVKLIVYMKMFWWIVSTIPNTMWIFVSKERVPQSHKPPRVTKGLLSVFKNRPLLINMISGFVGGIDIGTSESLYYANVLNFSMLPTIAGIPGSPISYASYPLATKLRRRFSTKALYMMSNLSISFSETLFFAVGLIGGKENGFYLKKVPMTIAACIGNCVEMLFYATKKIVGNEIDFEILDYCEWKNGYRVEATINLIRGYFDKVKSIALRIINAYLLEKWAGFQIGADAIQTIDTKWRVFLTACGPKLIFDLLGVIPMLFYNIDAKMRERMYLELEHSRALTAARVKRNADEGIIQE